MLGKATLNRPAEMVSTFVFFALLAVSKFASASPLAARAGVSVSTPLGTAQGIVDADGAYRFAVRYATANRWGASSVATQWDLPNGFTDPAAYPLICPQTGVAAATYSEDCLSVLLYVPPTLNTSSHVSTVVWVHGGSFIMGSATGTGLDGSKLAIATNSIVAVIQYRLGALGLLAPNGSTNLAVVDVMNSLKFLGKVLASFGGSASKITLAGQSSGAGMIRTLLAVPSASTLFQSAILHSDPMDYGFLSMSTQAMLQSTFNSQIGCSASDSACQSALSVSDILNAQTNLGNEADGLDASTGLGEPIRSVKDGVLVTNPLDLTAAFPTVSKPLLLTNVKDEGGWTVYDNLFPGPDAYPTAYWDPVLQQTLGSDRTTTVDNSDFYPLDSSVDMRVPLQTLVTDSIWRCPTWTFARNWAANGGSAYVGVFTVGATYPVNQNITFCTTDGAVCHQDDIEIIFGTVSSPSAAQSSLITEVQARYKAFLATGNPNGAGLASWSAAEASDVHPLELGTAAASDGLYPTGACDPSFWGSAVPYDYQVYGI
ncbi:unnamed protein product [Mycena citricolor]|uniref:Carboxylic ester hydrolase n=1 Tax=Mycena citricolor TaxID=2018698 RepID=A0AAD2Q5X5_9AGAR|nr:unnamed protein product [Mycena citricolor]